MFSNPQIDIYNSIKERNLFMSGIGGGKTFIGGVTAMKFITKFPEVIGFIGANTYSQLSKSTLKSFFNTWQTLFGITNGIHYVVDKIPPDHFPKKHIKLKSYENTICFDNGAIVFTASLDNYKVIDGTEFGYAFLDETKDTKEEAVKEVIVGRLRQKGLYIKDGLITNEVTDKSINPLFITTSPAKVLWLNEWFNMPDFYDKINQSIFSKTDYFHHETERRNLVICSNYHNEVNLPNGYIQGLIDDFKGNPHLIDMLIYGSPIAKSGGEFYHQFSRLRHLGQTKYNPDLALHISFDFNVKPYITATISQIYWENEKYKVEIIKEYALTAPHNNSEDLSSQILLDFQSHKSGAFVYGDASGKNRQTVSKEFRHNYDVIEHYLRPILASNYDRVTRRNPPLVKRRDFINKILASGYDIELKIDNSCKYLITDLEFIKESPTGGKLKTLEKDSNTGESYEKLGHMSDSFDYFICGAFETYFISN